MSAANGVVAMQHPPCEPNTKTEDENWSNPEVAISFMK
jgi:hypothetical protein